MKNYSSQRGVALLTILVMVALATILALQQLQNDKPIPLKIRAI